MPRGPRRSRGWCFTLNNYTTEEKDYIQGLASSPLHRYIIVGEECGEQGTPHLQGYIYFGSMKSIQQVKTYLRTTRAHIERAKGTGTQNKEYCSKEGAVLIEHGDLPASPKDRNSTQARIERNKKLLDLSSKELVDGGDVALMSLPRLEKAKQIYNRLGASTTSATCRGVWIYGPPGTGKTHWVVENEPNLFWKPQNKWWDGYAGEKAVLLDDLDTKVLGHYLKRWCDKYQVTGETKGASTNLQYERFYITSNYTPEQLWEDDDMMCQAIRRRCDFKTFLIVHEE